MIYFLCYLATGNVLFTDRANGGGNRDQIIKMKEMKIKSKPKDFLKSDDLKCFITVSEYIFSIQFDAEPNYSKIKFMFMQILLDRDMVPTKEFDWNQRFLNKENQRKEEKKYEHKIKDRPR